MMIRTIGATPLAVSQIWAFTDDEEPYPQAGYSQHIFVKNNYFARTGINVGNSPGLVMNFVRWKTITHNEFKDMGYSGMIIIGASGANWYSDHSHSYIAFNNAKDTNKMMQDGGPIYVLGYAPYSIMEGNYLEQTNTCQFGYYTDNGSSGWHFVNNAIEDHVFSYSFYTAVLKNGTFGNFGRDMYATQDNVVVVHPTVVGYDDYGLPTIDNDVDDVKTYVRGQPNREVYNIVENSGLEPEYEWLRTFDAEDEDHFLDYYEYYDAEYRKVANFKVRHETSAVEEAQNMVNDGKFGYKLGEFPSEYKSRLKAAIKEVSATTNSDWAEKVIRLRKLCAEAKENLNRYSVKETLAMCKELQSIEIDDSEKPKMNTVSSKTMNKLNQAVSEAEMMLSGNSSYRKEFDALVMLEQAYNDFDDALRTCVIKHIDVSGAENVDIDTENKTAVVYLPGNISPQSVKDVNITLNGNADFAALIDDEVDWGEGVTVPFSCKDNDEIVFWNVKIENTKNTQVEVITGKSFKNGSMEKVVTKEGKNSVFLKASHYPYMSTEYNSEEKGATLKLRPHNTNGKNELTMILGAKYVEDFQINSNAAEYDRVEVRFEEDKTSIYSVSSGKEVLIGTVDDVLNFDGANEISYSFDEINNTPCLNLILNGKVIANNALCNKVYDFYCGLYSPDLNVEILQ